jgi:hypothetical protein
MSTTQHLTALRKIINRLKDNPESWVITGSLGLALQGVPVEIHDIDIQTDRDGAYEIERRLSEFVKQSVQYSSAERIRSHLGKLEIDGIQVDVMGAVQKCLDDQSWEKPVDIERYRRWVEFDGMRIPVFCLEYEQEAYLKLGRVEKAEMLRDWLNKTGLG